MTATPRRWSVTFTETRRADVVAPDLADGPDFPDRQATALLNLARRPGASVAVTRGATFVEAHPLPDDAPGLVSPTTPSAADSLTAHELAPRGASVSTVYAIAAALTAARAEERATIAAAVAEPLAAYNEAGEVWREANAAQDDAPSVKDAETYSDRLENAAHAFAAVLRDLADGVTSPPADPVRPCRTCGGAVYLAHRGTGPIVGGTGPTRAEHWRHVADNLRHCDRGNGAVAEPYDGAGPLAEKLRDLS